MQFKEGYKQSDIGLIPDDWEVAKLEDIAVLNMGQSPENQFVNELGVGVAFTQGNTTFGKKYLKSTDKFCLKPTKIASKGDVIFSVRAPVGEVNITSIDLCLGRGVAGLTHNEGQNEFLYQLLVGNRSKFTANSQGSTFTAINKSDLGKTNFALPSVKEQQKIAEILSTVDAKLGAIDAEIEQTQILKKGLMQTLLTQGIGHTQFKDSPLGQIPESWEVKHLKQVVVDSNGLRRGPFGGALKKEIFVEQGFQVYEQRNAIYDDFITSRYFIDEVKFNSMKDFQIESGDFIVSCSGTIGKIAEVPSWFKKGVINQALLKIKLDNNVVVNKYFLQYFRWEKFQNKIVENTQGGAMKNLVGMTVFKNTFVPVPSIEEQTKIANILSTVDDKIELLQQRKAETETLKKGLMQKLLTGEVRVKVA